MEGVIEVMSDALKEMREGAMQKSVKRMKKREQLKQSSAWGSMPGVFQEGWRPAWLQQAHEKEVGGGGVREVRVKGEVRL